MIEGRTLGIVRTYDDLHAIVRARADELQVTRETLDHVSGMQPGYAAKVLAPVPLKRLGPTTLPLMLGAMGLALLVVEDQTALQRVSAQLTKRVKPMRTADAHELIVLRFTMRHMKKLARLASKARSQIPKRKRSVLARRAAKARWRKPRLVEITNQEVKGGKGSKSDR